MAGISKKNEGRISLALKPATAAALRQLAYLAHKSVNDYIGVYLDALVARNQKILDDLNTVESKASLAVQADISKIGSLIEE